MSKVPFFMHDLGAEELASIEQVFKGPILTTGEYVAQFEKQFSDYMGLKYVFTTSSCTAALHLSLMAMGIGPGDEVITTPMTFIATLQAIMFTGARPVLVDVEPDTGNLDISKVEQAITSKTKAVMPVHLYGLMVDMKALKKICESRGIRIVEDAAHCIEGNREGVRPGQLGDTVCFSYFATKNLTSGEGGAVGTNDESLAKTLKLMRNHGMNKTAADRFKEGYTHWDVDMLGWKYNMGNIEAAILLPQMKRLDQKWQKREEFALKYEKLIREKVPGIRFPNTRPQTKHARHLFPIWIPDGRRDEFLEKMNALGVGSVVNYRAVHLLSYFSRTLGYKKGDFPIAEKIGNETISIPFYPNMPTEHIDQVVEALEKIYSGKALT